MAKSMAFLEYAFFFDPKDTWSHLSQFENSFAKFLKEHGMEGQILNSINPNGGKRIVYIRALTVPQEMPKPPEPVASQDVIKKYTNPKTYQGDK